MHAMLAEVTQAQEVAVALEVTRVAAMLAAETSTREAAVAWDNTVLRVNDAEDQATLAEREALKRVSRAEVENAATLASASEDAEGFACKIAFLEDELAMECQAREVSEREHREQFMELTLLQT
jgi:hypothetical protein